MKRFEGTPSDELPDVLARGRTDVRTVFVSMSTGDPDGRDADYLEWHTLDHRPEQHRLAGLRGSLRFVSTPACRAARAAGSPPLDATDHVMIYLFAGPDHLEPFQRLGAALAAGGRMPHRLPSVDVSHYALSGTAAAARVVTGADVIPWRPSLGAYLLIEDGSGSPGDLVEVEGVAGVWWATSPRPEGPRQLSVVFLDDDPVTVAARLRRPLEARWSSTGGPQVQLAAPFHTVVPHDWARHLP